MSAKKMCNFEKFFESIIIVCVLFRRGLNKKTSNNKVEGFCTEGGT